MGDVSEDKRAFGGGGGVYALLKWAENMPCNRNNSISPFLRGYGPLNSFICPLFVRPLSFIRHAVIRIFRRYLYVRARLFLHCLRKVKENAKNINTRTYFFLLVDIL